MYGILGLIMLVAASSGLGFYFSGMLKERANKLREAVLFLRTVERELQYSLDLTDKIIEKIDAEGRFRGLKAVSECAVLCRKGEIFPKAWEKSVAAAKREMKLTDAEARVFSQLSTALGKYDAQSQVKAIEEIALRMEGFVGEAEKKYEEKGTLYRTLGTLLGAGMAILLI